MIKSNPNTRMEEVDVLRGIGIVLMIMGHIGFGESFHRIIHAFHMPLFYFVSGYFCDFRGKKMRKYLEGKAKRLLVPYFVFSSVHFLLWILMNPQAHHRIGELLVNILLYPNADAFPIAGALWFLVSLFVVEVLAFFTTTLIKHAVVTDLTVCALALFASICTRVLPFSLPFTLSSSLGGLGIFYIAYRIKEKWNRALMKACKLSPWLMVLFSGMVFWIILLHETINMRVSWFGKYPVFWWINALAAIFLIWYYIIQWKLRCGLRPLWNILADIGRDSMTYLCLNQLVIMCIRTFAPNMQAAVVTLLVILLLWLLNKMLNQDKIKFVLGK